MLVLLATAAHAGGVAKGGECKVVRSQRYGHPDGSFKGTVSEYGVCAFCHGLSFLMFSRYL